MDREFCLMRGMDDSCLLSMTAAPGGRCIFLFSAEHPALSISVPMQALEDLGVGGTASFAGEDSMCCVEKERDVVRIRYIGLEKRARSYEIDATRFETSLIMLSAKAHDSNFASLS